MATRTIVTSQPDVACDVCARRLLRGEQPDVFLDAGRRRTVCELCAPRAAFEGWMRETEVQSLTLPPARARRARGLLARLKALQSPRDADAHTAADALDARVHVHAADMQAGGAYDAFTEPAAALAPTPAPATAHEHTPGEDGAHAPAPPAPQPFVPQGAVADADTGAGASETPAQPGEQRSPYLQPALEVFNVSEFPRRVAGVIRSLGAPLVTVRSAEHLASVVRIVVAWELCWYRYEVDLSEPAPEAQVIAQGSELAELSREDRQGNAAADDSGLLALTGA